jgi:excisionase family DNA binding protein
MQDRWLSVEEIAVYLGVSRDTIYSWVGKTDLPAHKVGRLWKFKTSEIDAWVRKKDATPGGDAPEGEETKGQEV